MLYSRVLRTIGPVFILLNACFASGLSAFTVPDEARSFAYRALRRGTLPDSALIVPLLTSGSVEDTLLAVSCMLARGDSHACLPVLRPRQAWGRPGADLLEERRILLLRHRPVAPYSDALHLWSAVPDRPAGRRALILILEDHHPEAESLITRWNDKTDSWPGYLRCRWHTAAGNVLSRSGKIEAAMSHWFSAMNPGTLPWRNEAAESLIVHVESTTLPKRNLKRLLEILLDSHPGAVIRLLRDRSPDAELSLIRGRALFRTGRELYGLSVLESLSVSGSSVAPEAIWSMAAWHKRMDRDDRAAKQYRRLVRSFPWHGLAPKALWEAAWAYERSGLWDQAATAYSDLIRRWPTGNKTGRALLRFGLVAWRKGDRETALKRFREGLEQAPHPRDRTALAYWVGKSYFLEGKPEEAFRWWSWAAVTDSFSYYGSQASWRLESMRRFRGSFSRTSFGRSDTKAANVTAWVSSWDPDVARSDPEDVIDEIDFLYRCGMMREGIRVLQSAVYDYYSSAYELSRLLDLAERFEDYRSIALIGSRIALLHEQKTGKTSPPWLGRLIYPVPYPDLMVRLDSRGHVNHRLASALIRKESMYDRLAESHAGARGLMQLLPGTAAEIRKDIAGNPDRIWSAEINLSLGYTYLNGLIRDFNGSLVHALAAYNAGPHNALRWIDALETDDLELWMECITYRETRWYIPTIIAFQRRYAKLWPDQSALPVLSPSLHR